jgi:hypothetical protein
MSKHRFGVFEPLPYYAESHFINQNRRRWSQEEISELQRENGLITPITLNQCYVLIKEFNERGHYEYSDTNQKREALLYVGKVLDMCPLAFTKDLFKNGATCTYGDWVTFNIVSGIRHFTCKDQNDLILLKDTEIVGVVSSPIMGQ